MLLVHITLKVWTFKSGETGSVVLINKSFKFHWVSVWRNKNDLFKNIDVH